MVQLRDYQIAAVNKLKSGSVLCGGVGSGKSITALSFWRTLSHNDVYIITTPKKRDSGDWEREVSKLDLEEHNHIFVDSWNNIKKYEKIEQSFFIFDEQRLVGNGAWVHAFLRIAKKNEWILLTATPGDTWMDYVPIFVANGFYRNRTDFIRRHVVYGRNVRYPVIERYLEESRLRMLKSRVLVEMDYRLSANINVHELRVGYDRAAYQRIMRERWNPYTDSPILDISACCRTLRRLVTSDEERTRQVREIVRRNRTIIFYNYDYELESLRIACNCVSIREWNGHKHDEIPKCDSWVYLVNYMAGAEAWECIDTNQMLFFSLSYSYKTMVQAAGRINRCNTPFKELHYYYFHSGSSIENAIERSLKNKRDFNERKFIF